MAKRPFLLILGRFNMPLMTADRFFAKICGKYDSIRKFELQ